MTGPSGLVVEVASVFNPSTKLGNPGGRWSRTFAVYRSTGLFLGDHSISQILHIPIRYHVSPEYLFWQQKHLCLRSFLVGYCCCGDGPKGGIHGKKKFIVDFQLLFGLLKLLLFIGSVGTLAIIFAILHLTVGDISQASLHLHPQDGAFCRYHRQVYRHTGGRGIWAVGICQGSLEGVRVPDGDHHLRPGGSAGMVPICLGIQDENAIQSGLQQRA
ncbi:hypothetical protein PAHAL_9G583100 [Panicum hallii]|uniref:Uncharacterized protein n=1 Tax=Panicum hallii TaxID=206008 RepID=A0A2T8I674_9POAL|nr:hypothetical protein PAHAL_9G583100 [Panicum hallii]